jgi:tyrosinase
MAKNDVAVKTRFEQVQQILHDAADGREAAYGGQPLWEYSRDKLLESTIHGVRLIAPEKESTASCCGHTMSATETKGRGSRSGIVLGLRGQGLFDGSQFPPLPWGGSPVAADDIQFISDWIDDGCPPDDSAPGTYELVSLKSKPISITVIDTVRVEEPLNAVDVNEYKYQHGELKQRMNIDCMDERQVEKVRLAFREMYELNKWPEDSRNYNNLALIHQNHCQHGWERFLTWHRIYLYEFEQALQDICPDVTLPYWDWTMPQYKPHQPDKGWRIPKSLQAYLIKDSLAVLIKGGIPKDQVDKLESLVVSSDLSVGEANDRKFPTLTEFFEAVGKTNFDAQYTQGKYRNRFIDALLEANALWYPLRYPGEYQTSSGKPSTINKVIHYHYPSADDMEQIMSLRTFRDFGGGSLYNDAFGFMDQNPHNTMHIWTGGQNPLYNPNATPPVKEQASLPMNRNKAVQVAGRKFHKREDLYTQPKFGDMFSNLTASYDPVFWPIHANVDRLWWEWQQRHPESVPADLDAVLTPWSYTARDTLDMYRFGYEYVKSTCIIPVGVGAPVGSFTSNKINIVKSVRDSFNEAEVRLHRVPQLIRSCFVRVFLNLPDADANTSLDNDHYAGYLAIFGHGSCYGGPGHCDIPPPRRRQYDIRPRDHNTPRNHRVNVTKCARRLFERGDTSIQITLVVIGVDYQEDKELLRLEGVSLNFLD